MEKVNTQHAASFASPRNAEGAENQEADIVSTEGRDGAIDLSIIILSYKSKEHLKALLPSIAESKGVCFVAPSRAEIAPSPKREGYIGEVIVVDNDSQDGTAEFAESFTPDILPLTLIRNANNGFAAGNNAGIKKAGGRYVLLLNPDTKVEPGTFKTMLDFMETHPDTGISGCKVVKPDGSLDLACRRKFPNPWNSFLRLAKISDRGYNLTHADPGQEMEIDSVMGAFLLIRKSVIGRIGLLDESFFMYGEDLDWCWRCKEAGFKVWYYPKTYITHYKGSSSRKVPFKALRWFHEAMWIFYRKHYWDKYPKALGALVWLGIQARLLGLIIINAIKKNPVVSK